MTPIAKYRGSKEYLLVYSHIITAAQFQGITTYQDLATIMGLPLEGNHMGKEIGLILEEISEDERSHGRPMLTALVINTTGKPGPGFFGLAQRWGLLSDETEEGKKRFWEKEKKAVYATWKKDYTVDRK